MKKRPRQTTLTSPLIVYPFGDQLAGGFVNGAPGGTRESRTITKQYSEGGAREAGIDGFPNDGVRTQEGTGR